jgi:hypothetical protein
MDSNFRFRASGDTPHRPWSAGGTESLRTLRWRELDSNHRSLATSVGPVIENGETFASARPQAIPQYDAAGMLGSALS